MQLLLSGLRARFTAAAGENQKRRTQPKSENEKNPVTSAAPAASLFPVRWRGRDEPPKGTDPMTCQEVIDFLSDYLDGNLPWRRHALFLVHLGLCRDCRNYIASFEQTLRLMRAAAHSLDWEHLPPLPPELMKAIEAARK
jgi:hypothetical protein